MRKFYWILLGLLFQLTLKAATTTTVKTHSASMDKDIDAIVVTPDSYDNSKEFPVVYLLHGYSGNPDEWLKYIPEIPTMADAHQVIIVMADGNYNSWYLDSPIKKDSKYETYIAHELTAYIDEKYKTIAAPEGRAVTGYSMGGHGGLYVAFRNQDVFGACGSMSGGVDIRPFPNNWDMTNILGTQAEHPENWKAYTVMNQLPLLSPRKLAIIIDCGTGDFFYEVNKKLHEEMVYMNIPHDFIIRPGRHDFNYWRNALKYEMLFFSEFFNKEPS